MSALNPNALMALQDSFGLPLNNGYIYFGVVNADPQSNPIVVYWDAAQTQIAKQPLRTIYGRVYNNGTPAKVFASGNYSVQVLDQNKVSVLYDLNVAQPVDNPVTIPEGGTGATNAPQALINLGVVQAFVMQTYNAFTTAGTGTHFTLTPTPAIAANAVHTRFNVTFHAIGTATPDLSISGQAPQPLKQLNTSGVLVAAVISAGLISDVIDDGLGNFIVLDPIPGGTSGGGGSGSVAIRQTAQSGVRDSSGLASFLSAGAGLNFNVSTAVGVTPLVLSFANGFGATGQQDSTSVISADAVNQGALGFNNTNFAYAKFSNSISVTYGNTKAPPQYGDSYVRTKASLLRFNTAVGGTSILDDFGNSYAAVGGAKIQNNHTFLGNQALGGGGAGNILNGTTDWVISADFNGIAPPLTGWTMRGFINTATVPGAGSYEFAFGLIDNTAGIGRIAVGVFNTAGTTNFNLVVSSAGGTGDIINFVHAGTGVAVAATDYYVELTYDSLAGVYRFYVAGVQTFSQASALKAGAGTALYVGTGSYNTTVAGVPASWNGYIGNFEYLPYCDHPAGVSYLPPAAPSSIATADYAQDWYDIGAGLLKSPSAPSVVGSTNPTFTASQKVYLGEFDTNGTNVTASRSYAFNGRFDQTFATTAVSTTKNHNIGVQPGVSQLFENGITQYKALTLSANSAVWTAAVASSRLLLQRGF